MKQVLRRLVVMRLGGRQYGCVDDWLSLGLNPNVTLGTEVPLLSLRPLRPLSGVKAFALGKDARPRRWRASLSQPLLFKNVVRESGWHR